MSPTPPKADIEGSNDKKAPLVSLSYDTPRKSPMGICTICGKTGVEFHFIDSEAGKEKTRLPDIIYQVCNYMFTSVFASNVTITTCTVYEKMKYWDCNSTHTLQPIQIKHLQGCHTVDDRTRRTLNFPNVQRRPKFLCNRPTAIPHNATLPYPWHILMPNPSARWTEITMSFQPAYIKSTTSMPTLQLSQWQWHWEDTQLGVIKQNDPQLRSHKPGHVMKKHRRLRPHYVGRDWHRKCLDHFRI